MISLLNSLKTKKEKIETQLPLYKIDANVLNHKIELPQEIQEIMQTAIGLYL